jgi:hypothetical protein
MMSVITFPDGALVLHKGSVCRVLSSERQFAKGLGYMKIPDGTEFNPMLLVQVLRKPDMTAPKMLCQRRVSSGAVESIASVVAFLKARVVYLEGVAHAVDP